jgi:membrane protein implicated in regulation of membrane protease activity
LIGLQLPSINKANREINLIETQWEFGILEASGGNMNDFTIWWLLGGALVAAELATGTFYLLMLAIGASAAAISAHLQFNLTTQIVVGSAVGGMAVVLWRIYQNRVSQSNPQEHASQHLDIGEKVQVSHWNAQGIAQVHHRGAAWRAICAEGQAQETGVYQIKDIQGNTLVLEKV